MKVVVISAGLSSPSTTRLLADELAAGAATALKRAGEAPEIVHVEVRPLAHAVTDALLTGFPGAELETAWREIAEAAAIVAVTPVFSASCSGLFKSFFDVLPQEQLAGKPVVLGATAGTSRHSLVLDHALRPLFNYLKAVPVPTAVFAASEDFGPSSDGSVQRRAARAGRELATLLGLTRGQAGPAIAERRERSLEEKFAEPTPFAEMLSALGH